MKYLLLCFFNTCILVIGQILFKHGSKNASFQNVSDIIRLLFSAPIFCALLLYGSATVLWIYILSKVPISFVYPIQALAFPLVLVASMVVFNEKVSIMQWIGVSVIVFGCFLTTRG